MAFKIKPPFMALESEMSLEGTSTPPKNRNKSRRKAIRKANRGFFKRRRGCGPRGCHGPKGNKSRLAGL